MPKHLTIRISGKVQGVFFRGSTKERADMLGIKGFVRNEPDGSVWIEAEGDDDTMDTFVSWCKKGPPMAYVEKCEVEQHEWVGFHNFSIQRH